MLCKAAVRQDALEPSLETGSVWNLSVRKVTDLQGMWQAATPDMHFTLGAILSVIGLAKLLSRVLDLPHPLHSAV